MIKLLKILFLTVLLPYINQLQAQTLSNKGREFWVGYGHHQFMETNNSQEMILYFSAEHAAHVVVTINGTSYREEYDVPANTVIHSKLLPKGFESTPASFFDARLYTKPPSYPGGTGSEGIFKKHAIHIESDVPIVAYAHIYGDLSSGATMLMPVETWGHSYISVNTPQYYNGSNFNCFSWMYVVAKQNNTRIRIVPTVDTRKGDKAGVPIIVTLQKGDVYQLVGAPIDRESGQNVAGTTVTSVANDQGECYPIALFSGSSRTRINCVEGGTAGSGDNIMQQAFPLQAWGKRYLTSPTSVDNAPISRNINIFRIIVKDPATIVKKNGMQLLALNTSQGYYYEYQSNTADFIEADKPILVAQYLPSANACSYQGFGDPEMIFISPIEQSIRRIGFYRNTDEAIKVNYLSLIIPTAGVASLSIDGVKEDFDDLYAHPNFPGYSVVVKRWVAAKAQCIVESDSAFTAITYGLGGAESYGYNAGTYINNLNGYPGIKNQYSPATGDNAYTCVNTSVELSVLMRYQPTELSWKLSELAGTVSPAVDVIQTNPLPNGTQNFNGIIYYRYSLPGFYRFSKAGFHSVPLYATSPTVETCNQTEKVEYNVTVKAASSTGFDIDFKDCSLLENINFTAYDTLANGTGIYNWQWIFAGNDTARGKTITKLFNAGSHQVQLMAIDSVGCVTDTVKSFTLTAKPRIPEFNIIYTDSCAGALIVFEDKNAETGVKKWLWDFGANDTLTVFDSKPVSKQFLLHDTILVKHVAKNSENCVSDTATGTVIVYANPDASFNMPGTVCMPSGRAQFTNASTIPDGSFLSYQWQFGDGTQGSTDKDPVHIYNGPGNYTVTLKTSSPQGCTAEATELFNRVFNQPVASFSVLPDKVCQGVASQFSDESSAENSTINSWTWDFGDNSTSNQQHPLKLYNNPGTFNVKLVVKNAEGCASDTASKPVNVYLQPAIEAGRSFIAKEGDEIQFEATANSTSLSFRWSPATGLDNANILQPKLKVTIDAVFTLTATGEHNCTASDDLTVSVQKTVFIPNAFSPNGDGLNDVWNIKYIELYPNASIDLFDRYGSTIYRTTGTGRAWDGTIKGKPAPIGIYHYLVNLKDGSPVRSGSVTLLR